ARRVSRTRSPSSMVIGGGSDSPTVNRNALGSLQLRNEVGNCPPNVAGMTDEAMAANLNGDESSLRGSAGGDRRESIRRNRVVPSGDDEGRDGQLLQREVVCGDVRHEPSKIAPSHR